MRGVADRERFRKGMMVGISGSESDDSSRDCSCDLVNLPDIRFSATGSIFSIEGSLGVDCIGVSIGVVDSIGRVASTMGAVSGVVAKMSGFGGMGLAERSSRTPHLPANGLIADSVLVRRFLGDDCGGEVFRFFWIGSGDGGRGEALGEGLGEALGEGLNE
jgi:hypothetical protein